MLNGQDRRVLASTLIDLTSHKRSISRSRPPRRKQAWTDPSRQPGSEACLVRPGGRESWPGIVTHTHRLPTACL